MDIRLVTVLLIIFVTLTKAIKNGKESQLMSMMSKQIVTCENYPQIKCSSDRSSLTVCYDESEPPLSLKCPTNKPYCSNGKCGTINKNSNVTATVVSFTCTSDGVFPDPTNCTNKYICNGSNVTKESCNPGFIFNSKFNRCDRGVPRIDHASKKICSKISCDNKPNGYILFTANQAFYAFCFNNSMILYKCEDIENQVFDISSKQCIHKCRSAGYFADPLNCTKYYFCKGLHKFRLKTLYCATGQYFNGTRCVIGICDSTTEPPTSTTEPPTNTTEPPTNTTEPPTNTTEPPTTTTESPTTTTESPTFTSVPFPTATSSTTTTEPPTTTTEASITTTESPTITTETPTFTSVPFPTETPTTTTEPPATTTEPPTSTTEPPTSTTEQPTSTTEQPTSTTEPPTTTTEQPTSTTEPPTTTTEQPTSTTEPPTFTSVPFPTTGSIPSPSTAPPTVTTVSSTSSIPSPSTAPPTITTVSSTSSIPSPSTAPPTITTVSSTSSIPSPSTAPPTITTVSSTSSIPSPSTAPPTITTVSSTSSIPSPSTAPTPVALDFMALPTTPDHQNPIDHLEMIQSLWKHKGKYSIRLSKFL